MINLATKNPDVIQQPKRKNGVINMLLGHFLILRRIQLPILN